MPNPGLPYMPLNGHPAPPSNPQNLQNNSNPPQNYLYKKYGSEILEKVNDSFVNKPSQSKPNTSKFI